MSNIPNLHDAELYLIHHDAGAGTIKCVFRTPEGEDVVLKLSGVSKFRCTDFGLQNVVFEVVGTSWEEVSHEDLRSHVAWLFSTSGAASAKAEKVALAMQDISAGNAQGVFLIPSWGAQVGAIASKVEWQ